MTAAVPAWSSIDYHRLPIPAAAFEVLACLLVVAAASLAFLAGWLSVNGAVVLTVALLLTLIVLSWVHLGQGRHPVFLFLCMLMFFQGGRLLAFCLSGGTLAEASQPMAVHLYQFVPFNTGRMNEGAVLLCLNLSAICIYAPCRWRYVGLPAPPTTPVRQYLPYLYLVFFATLPLQIYRNYSYYTWIQEHGGYMAIFQGHAELAASVPLIVRAVPVVSLPALMAIFLFEHRKSAAYITAALYMASASFILIVGSRMAFFRLVLTLWFAARIKSNRKSRVASLAALIFAGVLIADVIGQTRENPNDPLGYSLLPLEFVAVQGQSLDVTTITVAYREYFQPYIGSYLWNDLKNAFVSIDTAHYSRGRELSFDAPVLLNVELFRSGYGTGGSYLGEAYLMGGVAGVVIFSLLIGFGLQYFYSLTRSMVTLYVVVLTLPEVLFMPRGSILDWASGLLRNAISILILWLGWKIYSLVCSVRQQHSLANVR
jgi:oligosaccharide repeat unit polymerase